MAPRPKFAAAATPAADPKFLKHKRRYCRHEGCGRIVKSQGLCQRHGAKPRKCKVEGCEKQAQGNFDRMCKSHFKAMKRATTPLPKVDSNAAPPSAEGFSVYDEILPASMQYVPQPDTRMPLIAHLKAGFDGLKPPAWHRNEERRARGMFPVDNPATQLEGWERELVWMEILVLTGAPKASFRHLARAWGRDKGFHMVLAQFICERHGDVRRKRRQGDRSDDEVAKRQPKKSRPAPKKKQSSGVISADIWDDTVYGDADTNEALAADIFNFSAQEFENVSSKWKGAFSDLASAASSPASNLASHVAMAATLGERGQGQELSPGSSRLPRPQNQTMATANTGVPLHSMHQIPRYQQNSLQSATPHLQQLPEGQQQLPLPLQNPTVTYGEGQQQQHQKQGLISVRQHPVPLTSQPHPVQQPQFALLLPGKQVQQQNSEVQAQGTTDGRIL